jgi:hypothetical protein
MRAIRPFLWTVLLYAAVSTAAAQNAITLTSSPNPSTFGQSVSLTATVPGVAGLAIRFFDGSVQLNAAGIVTNNAGVATFTTAVLAVGVHSLTAAYTTVGTAGVVVTSPPVRQQVNAPLPTVAFTATPNPASYCAPVTLRATVSPPAGATGQPTGSVTFTDGSTTLATVALANGVATYFTSSLAVGVHGLTASYSGDQVYSPASATVSLTVAQSATSTTLAVTPNPSTFGQSLTLTATVTSACGVSGAVTFLDGANTVGTAQLSNGTASFSTSTLTAGSHSLTARYGGDFNNAASTSATVIQVVAKISTSTVLASSPNPSNAGQAVVLTARVTPATATGTVTFTDGSATLGTGALSGGAATFTTSSLLAGTHSLTAAYNGDTNYASSVSNSVSQVVSALQSSITLTVSATSTTVGQPVTLTAAVIPSTATGTVTFLDGSTPLSTVNLINGSASYTTAGLSPGNHTLTASYSGNSSLSASVSPPVALAVLPGTLVTLAASPGSTTYGQAVTLTARVTPASATGAITFLEGATTINTATLSGGAATATVSTLAAGIHTLRATYGGDANNGTGTSNTVTLTVARAATTTTLSASPNPSAAGQTVTITAAVSPSTATGIVTFLDGSATLGTAPITAGRAVVTTASLALGTHSLTASYPGDANFSGSTSAAVSQVVSATGGGLTVTGPATLPNGTVGVAYNPQTFAASGGIGAYTWSLASSGTTTSDLRMSATGVLSGTPQTAGTFQITVQVQDSASPPAVAVRSYAVTFAFAQLPAITVAINSQPQTPADQPVPQVTLAQAYPVALRGTFGLSFTPNAAALPANYNNTAVQFATGGTTAQVTIPANSTAPVSLPAVQIGSVAGAINIQLTALVNPATNQAVPMPSQPPPGIITVPRIAPVIVPGSVKLANITASGFQLTFDANSTPRDVVRANVTFTPAGGGQLTGTQSYAVDLASAGTTWFPSAAGVAAGGAFSVQINFGYTGDTTALGSASVTLTNSVGTSSAVSGGR